ncbi:MAG TPA: FtsX-like permease family protein [Candidatus Sulfopaludibacter sp.]|nr:FtsX-like permease family protein [Candidatus Sulfopaludibacter sp.]
MRLLAGRDFDSRDSVASPRVAIVNQTLARKLGLGENPIGKRFRLEAAPGEPEIVVEVVDLVCDTRYYTLREDFPPIAFLSEEQDYEPSTGAQFLIRSAAPLADGIGRVRASIAATSSEITPDFLLVRRTVAEGLVRERPMATLSGFLGGLATLTAAPGRYGGMSHLAARRANEIGIRMALGADRGHILALILPHSAPLLAIGLAAGAVLALAGARAISSLLFGLQPQDTGTMALAILLPAAVTQAASYLPARRASRLEPVEALREE